MSEFGRNSAWKKYGCMFKEYLSKKYDLQENILSKVLFECIYTGVLFFISVLISLIFDRVILKGANIILHAIQNNVTILDIENGTQFSNWTIFRYLNKTSEFSIPRIYFFSIFFFFILLLRHWKKNVVYKYRYVFAGLLFFMLVIGKFSGSSMGFYDGMLSDNTEDYVESTLLGIPQGLRGDEWATEKPYYFAQDSVDYAYYNTNLMLDGCDMVISAFAPVKNIMIVTRPDLWGFLFLPRDYAFAFYWNLRIIILFMASFELGAMLTQKYKYGVVFGLMVCFAPPIQWWLSQTIMIIIWSGEYFIVFFNHVLSDDRALKKILYVLSASWMALIYIFTLYPAAQVPMGYIFAGLLLYVMVRNWSKKPFCMKNICCYGVMAGLTGCFCLYFYRMSGVAMKTLLNTVYPGKIRSWIALEWDYELLQLVNPFTWCKYLESINNCEASQYYSFIPFIIIGFLFIIAGKTGKSDSKILLIKILIIISGMLWMFAYLPEMPLINKITLLSFSYPVRILLASGYGFMLSALMIVSVYQKEMISDQEKKIKRIIALMIYLMLVVLSMNSTLLKEYIGANKIAGICILLLAGIYVYIGYQLLLGTVRSVRNFVIFYIALSMISTVFINPVTFGTDSMFEKETMKEIRLIDSKEKGRWIVSGHTTIANLVTAQGVARASGTYYYPDKEMMEIIDPKHEYENMWNQYAHIDMRLTDGENYITQYDKETDMTLSGVDRIVYINIDTARKLNIKYIFTKYDVPTEYEKSGQVVKLYKNDIDMWTIYKIC